MKYNKTISHNLTQSSSGFQIPVCPPSFWRVSFPPVHLTFLLLTSFVFLLTSNVFAQEAKQTIGNAETKVQQRETRNGTESTTAVGDKIRIRGTGNSTILSIEEETNRTASIKFYDKNDFNGPPRKLLNEDGKLMWGTEEVAGTYVVGDLAQGGYVIEVSPDGHHGLVAALQDQSIGVIWYESNDVLSFIANHEASGKNYKDWRLPTKRELNRMYILRTAIGGFSSSYYWSSTEFNNTNAWSQNITNGFKFPNGKTNTLYVRAVRAF